MSETLALKSEITRELGIDSCVGSTIQVYSIVETAIILNSIVRLEIGLSSQINTEEE